MPQWIKNLPENSGDIGDMRSIPGSERSSGEGNSNPLQYSCLKNPMDKDGGTEESHGLHPSMSTKSWTQLSN